MSSKKAVLTFSVDFKPKEIEVRFCIDDRKLYKSI